MRGGSTENLMVEIIIFKALNEILVVCNKSVSLRNTLEIFTDVVMYGTRNLIPSIEYGGQWLEMTQTDP